MKCLTLFYQLVSRNHLYHVEKRQQKTKTKQSKNKEKSVEHI